jgi:N-acetylmuramic acid 6-phosphate etherase
VVDTAVQRFAEGGRIHYFGAGTSGRLGLLDAAELPPTFGGAPDRVVAHHAGGGGAAARAVEDAEDHEVAGAADAAEVGAGDVAIGISASGRTPYVAGALQVAGRAGAFTVLVSSNPQAPLAEVVDRHVCVDTGPEPIAGSTRMKAGTAAKLVLNSFSTALMVRLGKTYSNLMVDVAANNAKLRGRVLSILAEASGQDEPSCAAALDAAGGDTKTALVSLLADTDPTSARAALAESEGSVRTALTRLADTVREHR